MIEHGIYSVLVAPLLAFLLILYMNYRFKVQTNLYLFYALLFGLLSTAIIFGGQMLAEVTELDHLRNLKRTAFYGIVLMAFTGELGKFIFLRYYFLPMKEFSGPIDGIIYAILIGLGFATAATLLLDLGIIGARVDLLYLYTYPIANVIFAIIMGFFVGLGKTRKNKAIDSLTGLFAATVFHGLYIFSFLTTDFRLLIIFAIGSIIIVFLLIAKALNIKAEDKLNQTP
ncbi:MAG: PrsW family intramembrane metalloprotease [Bacteroidales bacterium]|nr:PrsW family intramembrane metalloprotease [Bacteroidales bacterium]MCF8351432.1 PrsW family intramembrane metalloprotease [Bacteroidales bacterium]MCF8374775.1 PrsW family intramembrane metalloprotease [Bacteroidales bacterium]MCF8399821.1 PrsW family intramembrane metalloprotease [Bacteroidales bacterium]